MLRIVGGVVLGTVLGFIMGVVLGIAIAFWLLPPPPGHALDGTTPMIGIVFVCTVVGGPAGGLMAARTGRRGRQPDGPAEDDGDERPDTGDPLRDRGPTDERARTVLD